jgi:hypothetical protein
LPKKEPFSLGFAPASDSWELALSVARFGLFLRQFQEQQVLVLHSSPQTIVHSTGASVYGGVAVEVDRPSILSLSVLFFE